MTATIARVDYRSFRSVPELVGAPEAAVFSPAELRHLRGRRGLESWAGRLAAKRAVLDVLGSSAPLAAVEILPRRGTRCTDPMRCRQGHGVDAVLPGPLARRLGGDRLSVSISHSDGHAVALAVRG